MNRLPACALAAVVAIPLAACGGEDGRGRPVAAADGVEAGAGVVIRCEVEATAVVG